MIDSIIFDVDGTIWDSTFVVADAWTKELSKDLGKDFIVTADTLKRLFGNPMDKIMDVLFPTLDLETKSRLAEKAYITQAESVDKSHIEPYEGILPALESLCKKYPLFVVSNCQKGYIEAMYRSTGLGKYFKDKLCYGDTMRYKAENIREIIDKYSLSAPLYVGDTEGDHEASKAAGCKFAWASYGFGEVTGYDYLLRSPSDLKKL